jgi:hypothetical protein
MTQEQKDLLLRDLCARLPYFTKVQIKNEIVVLNSICDDDGYHFNFIGDDMEGVNIEEIKPYLFPLSSMTEEQKNSFPFSYSFLEALIDGSVYFDEDECITLNDMIDIIQWCYKNHFDIYGLIPMGLAIDATGKNIY